MPADDIVGGALAAILRFIGAFFVDIVFELLVRGLGYTVCRVFSRRADPESFLSTAVGLAAWGVIVYFAVWIS